MQQMRQPKESTKLKQIRYRKLTLAGGNTIVTYNSPNKPHSKGVFIEFPLIDNNNYDETNNQDPNPNHIDPRLYEDEIYKKSNYRAVKALMKVYEDGNKKKSVDSMNMLGLDIKKIHYEIPLSKNKQSLHKINKVPSHYSANPKSSSQRQYSPFNYTSKSGLITNNSNSKSLVGENNGQKFVYVAPQKTGQIIHNLNTPKALDNQSIKNVSSLGQIEIEGSYSFQRDNTNEARMENNQSTILCRKKKISSRESNNSREIAREDIINTSRIQKLNKSARPTMQAKNYSVGPMSSNQTGPSPTKGKNQKKQQQYLYQKLAGQEKVQRDEVNLIYDRRIRTFTDFLWKIQYSHGIYINLDLKNEDLGARGRRVKYYIGGGNNSAMIRGLLKRRYWWIPSQDKMQCSFVWTQIKVSEIFHKQRSAKQLLQTLEKRQSKTASFSTNGRNIQGRLQTDQKSGDDEEKTSRRSGQRKKQSRSRKQSSLSPTKIVKPVSIFMKNQNFNKKLMNEEDEQAYRRYWRRYEEAQIENQNLGKQSSSNNQNKSYGFKMQKCKKQLRTIEFEDNIVHNHLENNFYLGNKKALFYNLKQYYQLTKENLFDYVPLTFHIKKGIKDPEYKRFIAFYNRRKSIIKKEEKIEEEEGYLQKRKTRNIWIVKPGENSNQGRGITVIDEIYELNNIMRRVGQNKNKNTKSTSPKKNSCLGEGCQNGSEEEDDGKRTYIVQMYIDRPMLYNNRKFDIRHYMLITNLYGVTRAYWYAEGYIRTASYEFNIDNFEPEIHLTNDAIQKKYSDYGKYEPYNKISYEEFQRYLQSNYPTKKYNFKDQILPKMKKMATDAAKSVYTKISLKNKMNNFEIFGLDFMIDKNFRPWLIEINTNPCLDCTCPLLDRIIPYMVEQSFKLSLDVVYPPPNHYPNTCKHFAPMMNLETFKYELIFDSQIEGEFLKNLYRKTKGNLIDEIGDISDDEQFKDDGKEIKLDDFT